MNKAPIPTFASYLPTLARLIEEHDVKTALEFGMGLASTPLLNVKCTRVASIEMNSHIWYEFLLSCFGAAGWDLQCMLGPTMAPDLVSEMTRSQDLVLVDGHGDSRPEQIMAATKVTSLIVVHDVQEPGYHWERAVLPVAWTWTNVDTGVAKTAVLEGPG